MKDLGRLLAKYDARDWQPIVRLLTSNPKLLFEAISAAETKSSKVEKIRSKTGVGVPKAAGRSAAQKRNRRAAATGKDKPSSGTKLTRSHGDEVVRRVLSRASTSDLQALYLRANRKRQIPKNRSELTDVLDKYLQRLPESERTRFLRSVSGTQSDPTETYRRWVDIISKRPGDADE